MHKRKGYITLGKDEVHILEQKTEKQACIIFERKTRGLHLIQTRNEK